MSTDFNLVRAHFESALATLAQLRDFESPEDRARLLELATLAHGAGARRLQRMAAGPCEVEELLELQRTEEAVRSTLLRAQQENQAEPELASAAQ